MSWRKRSEEEIPDDEYVWAYDAMMDEVAFFYSGFGVLIDGDYTHWMYDEESPEEPERPEELDE